MTKKPAAAEAAEIDKLVPWPYTPGQYYPVEYKGRKFHATRKTRSRPAVSLDVSPHPDTVHVVLKTLRR